jgi:hypothetical protein
MLANTGLNEAKRRQLLDDLCERGARDEDTQSTQGNQNGTEEDGSCKNEQFGCKKTRENKREQQFFIIGVLRVGRSLSIW